MSAEIWAKIIALIILVGAIMLFWIPLYIHGKIVLSALLTALG